MVHGSVEKEVVEAELKEKEKEVMDTGTEEGEGVKVVDSNPLGRDSLQSELWSMKLFVWYLRYASFD